MTVSNFMAHKIVSSLYLNNGESGYISFPKSRTVFTWSHIDGQYYIFAANRAKLERAGGAAPVRIREGYNHLLDFTDVPGAAFDCWKSIAHFTRSEVFGDTTAIRVK